ncbi:MAG: hypothetical protein JO340_12000 [Acidobacteriaceae bacterium]|nr:hypothetical protein [Acidobacteriaceae bacterium]
MPTEAELADPFRENERLKRALEECSAAQQAAQAEAERAVKELQDFVYAASHDLQEPLRAVSAYAQLLQRKHAEDAETNEFIGFVIRGAQQATSLLQALLAYSRSGSSPHRRMANLGAIAQSALFKLNARVRESEARISFGELPDAPVDQTQIAQVFEQLVTNAIAYRSEEAPVIEISAQEGADAFVVSVSDNGKGIEARFHEQVFLPFKRLHGKEVAGTGLGLAVCRKIIAAHGGRIWVESDGEHGSTFKFTLPY